VGSDFRLLKRKENVLILRRDIKIMRFRTALHFRLTWPNLHISGNYRLLILSGFSSSDPAKLSSPESEEHL